ncbi:MarR family transcriptional regulator [Brachybacterium sp. NBEC-018]|uniref:MarR family winged helix-turn-helix transcriptional regulator n=1 Tax=Brachybacterium sp. NBEC-018 TaxID=2996004 RepID=UPI00217564D0|nr:MarR family transcriptional regulator [Brachybacterium sp. NBEC-018]UVY84456.1 MarR family transcriptional regulator [Brachybacterium sp. NBEC-018]
MSLSPADLPQQLTLQCSQFARMAARTAQVGVSSVSWRVAATLQRRGPLRLSEIAERERVTRSTATAVIQRLEEEGLVERAPDPTDSRSWLVSLTPAGDEQLAAWRSQMAERVGPLLEQLPDADRETLARATEILADLVEIHDA